MHNIVFKGILKSEKELRLRDTKQSIVFNEPSNILLFLKNGLYYSHLILFSSALIMAFTLRDNGGADRNTLFGSFTLSWLSMFFVLYLHELIHALFYPRSSCKEIWINRDFSSLFVYCTADVSKFRYIIICYAPNFFFGFLPLLAAFFLRHIMSFFALSYISLIGFFAILIGIGDYYNALLANTQVPIDGYIFNSGMHSYWFDPSVQKTGKSNSSKVYLILLISLALLSLSVQLEASVLFAYIAIIFSSMYDEKIYRFFGFFSLIIELVSLLFLLRLI